MTIIFDASPLIYVATVRHGYDQQSFTYLQLQPPTDPTIT